MPKYLLLLAILATAVVAQDEPVGPDTAEPETAEPEPSAAPADAVKTMSGMSILGNEEAPKSLVIVPWKSSRLGDGLGIANGLDESPRPVDRDVFMRELHFYELRSGSSD